MEDLRVLEEQQHDSQRKLAHVKILKKNRLERSSAVESQLASLKYKNGERRAQLNRAREILSSATHDMEAVKLETSRNDERLKAIDIKLKRALLSSLMYQTYRRKIDGRILNIRSRESVCHRLLCTKHDDFNLAESTLQDTQAKDEHLRQIITDLQRAEKKTSEEISRIRSESTGLSDDLHSSKHMEASTKLRAECIVAENDVEDARHADEMRAMTREIEESRGKRSAFTIQNESMTKELDVQYSKIHELWLSTVAIQRDEGHDVSPEPTEGGCVPSLDIDSILTTVSTHDQKLRAFNATRHEKRTKCDRLIVEMRALEGDHSKLTMESSEVNETSRQMHIIELERTRYHEEFLSALERERGNVEHLRSSLEELQNGLATERQRLQENVEEKIEEGTKNQAAMHQMRRSLALNHDSLGKSQSRHELEKIENYSKLEVSEQEVSNSRAAFANMQAEVEKFCDDNDIGLGQEAAEIISVQEIMLEETASEIARILKGKHC